MEYDLILQDGIFEVISSGDGEFKKFSEIINVLISHSQWKPGAHVFIDHSRLNALPLTFLDMTRMAEQCIQQAEKFASCKIAFVVSRELEFGMFRMWDALTSSKLGVTVDIFKSREEAIAWLMRIEQVGFHA